MKPMFRATREELARKPAHGSPCTNCGLCCRATLCGLALHIFGEPKVRPCPALTYIDGESRCGFTLQGTAERRAGAHWLIGAGTGCDARFNGEWTNQEFYKKLEQWDRDHAREVAHARKVYGMSAEPKR